MSRKIGLLIQVRDLSHFVSLRSSLRANFRTFDLFEQDLAPTDS